MELNRAGYCVRLMVAPLVGRKPEGDVARRVGQHGGDGNVRPSVAGVRVTSFQHPLDGDVSLDVEVDLRIAPSDAHTPEGRYADALFATRRKSDRVLARAEHARVRVSHPTERRS